jgi:exopolysaccharide production protein ExoQ
MGPSIAVVVFAVGIGILFFLNRDDTVRTSKFLWLPVIWFSISASRPISVWLGRGYEAVGDSSSASSLLDQSVAGILIFLGLIAIFLRRRISMAVLRASWPIGLYFSFCLFSLLFSDDPGWGFKRWARSLGDLIMALIVVTEAQPSAALRRFFSRTAFILFPASLLLVKYFPALSRYYSPEGLMLIGGVTTNKNLLGVGAFLLTLGVLWQTLNLIHDKKQPHRTRRLVAQGILLLLGIEILVMAHSATSWACFVLGAFLVLVIQRIKRPSVLHALILGILLGGGLVNFLGLRAGVTKALGRKSDLTGRTEIWKVLEGMDTNPMVGTGFETFWTGARLAYMNQEFPGINESHNGYLEIWLNLGGIGLILIFLVLGQGYRTATAAFHRDPKLGGLLIAYIVTAVLYNVTEAGFRMLGPEWIFIVLAVVASGRLGGVGISSSQQLPRRLPKPVWEPYSAGLPINVLPPSRPLETKKAMSSNH